MSFLEKLEPTKNSKTFEITAFNEDMDLFINAISYLQAKFKGGGKFTQESLFEHLTTPLREDKKLMDFLESHPKKKGRNARPKVREEKKPEVVQ